MLVSIDVDGSFAIEGEETRAFGSAQSEGTSLLMFGYPYLLDSSQSSFWASAELLLGLWQDRGPAMVELIDGSFSVLVVDAGQRRLDLLSDRFGTHHLFWAWVDGKLQISDRVAELASALPTIRPSRQGVQSFLLYGMILEDRSLIEGVRKFPPASQCRLELGRGSKEFESSRHWQAVGSGKALSQREAVELIVETFSDTVRRSAGSDGGPLSMPLTSGKDSRSILSALIGQSGLHCYTHGDPSDPDVAIAADLARRAGVPHDTYALSEDWIDAILDDASSRATAFNGSIDHLRFLHVLNSYAHEESRGGTFYPGAWANEIWEGKFLRPEFMSTSTASEAAEAALGIIENARGADYGLLAEDRGSVRAPFLDYFEGVIRQDPEWRHDRTSCSIRLVQHSYSPQFFAAFSSYLARHFAVFHSFTQRPIVEAMPSVPVDVQKRAGLQHAVILRNRPELADLPLFSEGVHRYIPSTPINRFKDRVHTSGVPRKLNTLLERTFGRGLFNRGYFVDYQSWLFERHRDQVLQILGDSDLICGEFLDRKLLSSLLDDFASGSLTRVRPLSHPLTRLLSLELFLRALR
jgi:hypothetical protein